MPIQNGRILQLDVLRSIAILLVIGRHINLSRPDGPIGFVAELWFRIGWLGVDLFFVLSGFLIGGLLISEYEKHGRIELGRFLIRRGLKIYPPYFVFIGYLILWPCVKALIVGRDLWSAFSSEWQRFWPNLLFLQNYVGTNPAGHTWSLAVEEHFYLLLPCILIGLVYARKMRWLIPGCLVAAPVVVLLMRFVSLRLGDPYAAEMGATHLRLDALLFGVGLRAMAAIYPSQFAALRLWRKWLVGFGVLAWLPMYLFADASSFIRTLGLTCTLLGAAAFLLAAYHTHSADLRYGERWFAPMARFLGTIGVYSYAIYLWHVTAIGVLEKSFAISLQGFFGTLQQIGWMVAAFAVTGGVVMTGVVATRLVEWPVLKLRDRLFPSRSGSVPIQRLDTPDACNVREKYSRQQKAAAIV
jgi:peptidoglycan/LPS O-acetylase OafA/YrhL